MLTLPVIDPRNCERSHNTGRLERGEKVNFVSMGDDEGENGTDFDVRELEWREYWEY